MNGHVYVWTVSAALLAVVNTVPAQGPVVTAASAPAPYYEPAQAPCQDCISHRCVLVAETKQIKKIVYEVQEVPYCVKKLPPLFSFHKRGCDCEQCIECDCVRYKRVLVKREIVCEEICTTKCVPEPCK